MKFHKKLLVGIILVLAILIGTVGLVNAQPRPIGATAQTNPFDSNPTAYSESDNSGYGYDTTILDGARMYDGRFTLFGFFYLSEIDYPGWVELNTFDTQSFTIGWVDIKIRYSVDEPTLDDTYSITYSTDGTTWVTLQPATTDQFDVDAGAAQTRSWAQVAEPNDGTWTWSDISNLRIRVNYTPGANTYSDGKTFYLYECWATVYEGPLPPSGSTGVSIQPPVVGTQSPGLSGQWFVEVIVQNVTNLAGYQITIDFNTTVLIPRTVYSYYPFTDGSATLNNTGGYHSVSYTIPIGDPLVNTGVSGNLTIARIYYRVVTGMGSSDYSLLTFSVSLIGDPVPNKLAHSTYHGIYGTPPSGMHIGGWIPASTYPYDDPISTHWVEQWPDLGREWHLTSWDDNNDSVLSVSDQIDMTEEEPPSGDVWWFHVAEIWECDADPDINVYMVLDFKYIEPVPEFPLGIGLMMILTLLIPTAYIWRLRKKVPKQ